MPGSEVSGPGISLGSDLWLLRRVCKAGFSCSEGSHPVTTAGPFCSFLTKCTIERGSPKTEPDLYAELLQLWVWGCVCPGDKEEHIQTNWNITPNKPTHQTLVSTSACPGSTPEVDSQLVSARHPCPMHLGLFLLLLPSVCMRIWLLTFMLKPRGVLLWGAGRRKDYSG